MIINTPMILESLEEWSSKEEQERLWLSDGSSGFVSSPMEAYERLLGDSNLLHAMEDGKIQLPSAVIDALARFEAAFGALNSWNSHRELIDNPGMIELRQIADELLIAFKGIGTDGRLV